MEQRFPLAEESDWHRTYTCYYCFDGVINEIDGKNCVFTHGKTGYTWRHLARVGEAVMYGKLTGINY